MDRGAEAVARRGHAGVAGPAIAVGIVGLDLGERAGGGLAADHEDASIQHRRGDAAARRGKRVSRCQLLLAGS